MPHPQLESATVIVTLPAADLIAAAMREGTVNEGVLAGISTPRVYDAPIKPMHVGRPRQETATVMLVVW